MDQGATNNHLKTQEEPLTKTVPDQTQDEPDLSPCKNFFKKIYQREREKHGCVVPLIDAVLG